MSKEEYIKKLQEKNGGYSNYEIDLAEKALDTGATVEQVNHLWENCDGVLTFRNAIGALIAGFPMPYAQYFLDSDIAYSPGNAVLRGFKEGITLEQAQKYFTKELGESQIQGMCELLLATSEENAAPYLSQPFRLRQFQSIAHGFKNGYTMEQIALYAKPEVNSHTMQAVCKMIDRGISKEIIKCIVDASLNTKQLELVSDAVFDDVPLSVLKLICKKNCLLQKMQYILQGHKEGFSDIQLLQLSNGRHPRELDRLYNMIKTPDTAQQPASVHTSAGQICEVMSYDILRSNVIQMLPFLTAAQKKELTNLILFGENK